MAIIESTAVGVRRRGRTKRRLPRMLIVVAAALSVIGLTAVPASATQTCTPVEDAGLNAFMCLSISRLPNSPLFAVLVGIDVQMSPEEAQKYVIDPDRRIRVEIFGEDGGPRSSTRTLFTLPRIGIGAGENGFGADFERQDVTRDELNEDESGQDEIRARVTLRDIDTNTDRAVFESAEIDGNWP